MIKKYLDFSGLIELVNKLKAFFQKKEFTGTHDEWNRLTPTEKANYEIVNFTDDLECAYQDVYSTSEVKTNKVWVDGKPIYRTVITGYTDATLLELNVPHNIANLEWMTSIGGGLFNNAAEGNDFIPFGFYNPRTDVYYLSVLAGQITFRLRYCALYCDKQYKVVLEYTKTTD